MFLRLMLLVPMIRQFMLLDVGIMPDDSEDYVEPPYERLDDLAILHARALLHMHKLGWPLGNPHRIPCGEKWVPGERWYNRGHYETVYESSFGVTCFPDIIFMRSGAIYGQGIVRRLQRDGSHRRTQGLLDLALIDDETRRNIKAGLEYILELRPEPVYIDN